MLRLDNAIKTFITLMCLFDVFSCNPTSVSVSCSENFMAISITFDEPFFGRISSGINAACAIFGEGRQVFQLKLSLEDENRRTCGIEQHDDENFLLMDVAVAPNIVTAEDVSYFVKCPIHYPFDVNTGDLFNLKNENFQTTAKSLNHKRLMKEDFTLETTSGFFDTTRFILKTLMPETILTQSQQKPVTTTKTLPKNDLEVFTNEPFETTQFIFKTLLPESVPTQFQQEVQINCNENNSTKKIATSKIKLKAEKLETPTTLPTKCENRDCDANKLQKRMKHTLPSPFIVIVSLVIFIFGIVIVILLQYFYFKHSKNKLQALETTTNNQKETYMTEVKCDLEFETDSEGSKNFDIFEDEKIFSTQTYTNLPSLEELRTKEGLSLDVLPPPPSIPINEIFEFYISNKNDCLK